MVADPTRARVLSLDHIEDAAEELRLFGAHVNPDTLSTRAVRLDVADREAAYKLREAYTSVGACAFSVETRDGVRLLLYASGTQHTEALATEGLSPLVVNSIRSAMRNYELGPLLPDANLLTDARVTELFSQVGGRTLVMGVLNVTPDSFSDGGQFINQDAAVGQALTMANDGADIIDVGGESTRPGAEPVSAEEEIARIVPVISSIARSVKTLISVDTCKAEVAEAALIAGASMVNDISGTTFDPAMPSVIENRKCPAVLMHIKGVPRNMQINPVYDDLMGEIFGFLSERIAHLKHAGVDERLLIVDPGIGFGKTAEHNLQLMRRLAELRSLGRPLLTGSSRKSTIGRVLGDLPVNDRLEGTAATVTACIMNGADIIRVHDVRQMARVAKMTDAIVRGWRPEEK